MIFLVLYFQDKLPAVLRIYRDTLITVMKASIKATVAELLPVLTARPIDSDSVTGDRAADADGIDSIHSVFLNRAICFLSQLLHALLTLTFNCSWRPVLSK
jgi:hypothetical protein